MRRCCAAGTTARISGGPSAKQPIAPALADRRAARREAETTLLLRRLELMGFKSFADKTSIEFGPGISAIVGPNGSGKSNITDAIRWVLGEVSARALRGHRMEDVIFGGTAGRRAVPLAEVTLTLDNTDATLPIPFAEVSVTRRVDRSGQSDYLINRAACRLRDVQDLFAGTGLGRNAYAIVSQGEVEDVLRARAIDRRAMVEEAAGVTRYRQRLHDGNRRLASADACEQRLGDLLTERQRALDSLHRQAERALAHRRAADELRALELRLWAREWGGVRGERDAAATAAGATALEHEALADDLGSVGEEQREIAAALQAARTRLESESSGRQQAERTLDRARQEVSLAAGLGSAAAAEAERAQARLADLRARHEAQAAELAVAEEGLATAEQRAADARSQAGEGGEALAAATEARQAASNAHGRAQAALAACRQQLAAVAGSSGAQALAAARDALSVALQRVESADAEAAQAQAAAVAARAAITPTEATLAASRRVAVEVRGHRDALAAMAGALRGRVQVLAEVAASGAGYAQGPRTVLAGRQRGVAAFSGVIGALGELVEVPKHLATAISAALGGAVQDIVTESADAAQRAIEGLKAAQGGRATFLPLDAVRPAPPSADLRSLASSPGALGWASELVTCEPRVRPAVQHALGRVLVAQDLAVARRIGREAGYRVRIVTLEGDVVHPGGAMSGGSVRGERAGGLLGRDQERRRLQERWDAVQTDQRLADAALGRAMAAQEEAERALAEARRAGTAAEAGSAAAANTAAAARREQQRVAAQEAALQERLRRQGQVDPEELARREAQAAREAEAEAARLAAAEALEARCREALTAARIALATAEQAAVGARADQARLRRDQAEFAARLREVEEDRGRAQATVTAQQDAEAEARVRVGAAERALEDASARCEAVRREVGELQARAAEAAARRQWAEQERERVGTELRRVEATLAKADGALAALAARLETAYGLSAEALAEVAPSERPGPDRDRANTLRRELNDIGGVRQESVAEYRAEAAAVTAFASDAQDIHSARQALEAWGREIEGALADRYEQTLAAVRRHFAAVYARLSGGGAADLIPVAATAPGEGTLEHGEIRTVPRESPRPAAAPGLEIVAQPPGKQLAHLGLLSGGERTLVAIALVLAFLRVRPTAFCVMDEIEAALDDANVGRCAAYLGEVSAGTQIIVVTHQKGTMEVADRLVGVTMGEPGISRLLSVRLAG